MKIKNIITVLLFAIILASCAPAVTAVPTETVIPTSTFTPIPPTLTPVPSATSTETPIPPLESQPTTQESVSQFASAMQKAGINITAEQILQQGLLIQTITGTDGKQYEIATTHIDPDPTQKGESLEGDYPLMIKTEGREWTKITPRNAAEINANTFGSMMTGYWVLDPPKDRGGRGLIENFNMDFNGQASADLNWMTGGGYDLHPNKATYDFRVPDAVIKNATDAGLKVDFQSMFWGDPSTYPKWLNEVTNRVEFLQVSRDYVSKVASRYKGKVDSYVLINEFFGWLGQEQAQGNLLQLQLEKLGIDKIDFITEMSGIIHDIDPQAHILINDSGTEIPGTSTYFKKRSDLYIKLLKDLKDKGAFVNTIGLQFHLNAHDFSDKQSTDKHYLELAKRIQLYNEMGYRVQVTELDVRLNELSGLTQKQRYQLQAEIYGKIISTLLENGVNHITVWGIADPDSFFERASWMSNPEQSDPLLFSNYGEPKLAYYAVLRGLLLDLLQK